MVNACRTPDAESFIEQKATLAATASTRLEVKRHIFGDNSITPYDYALAAAPTAAPAAAPAPAEPAYKYFCVCCGKWLVKLNAHHHWA